MYTDTSRMARPAFAYHPTCPQGRIFDLGNDADRAQIVAEGWVDSPAKLAPASEPQPAPDLDDMLKADLVAYAEAHGVEIGSDMTKAEIRAAIEAHAGA